MAFCERNEWLENGGVALQDCLVDCEEKGENTTRCKDLICSSNARMTSFFPCPFPVHSELQLMRCGAATFQLYFIFCLYMNSGKKYTLILLCKLYSRLPTAMLPLALSSACDFSTCSCTNSIDLKYLTVFTCNSRRNISHCKRLSMRSSTYLQLHLHPQL